MPYAEPLSPQDIERLLNELPGWSLSADQRQLTRTYHLAHLPAAVFAVHIASIQEELNHHSDLTLGYDTVSVSITTHAAGSRLTHKDFNLAKRIAEIAPGHGAH